MDALVGGLGCDSAAGNSNPLGNLVDGFLDRTRVAEQMVRARLLELLCPGSAGRAAAGAARLRRASGLSARAPAPRAASPPRRSHAS